MSQFNPFLIALVSIIFDKAMDDMTVEEECVIFFLKKYFELRGSTVHHVHNIQGKLCYEIKY